MAPLKVLITGAGVAGSALGFWLAKANHDVTIIERHPVLRTNGLQIDLRGDGVKAMKAMGLEKEFRARVVHEEGVALVDGAGTQHAFFPAMKTDSGLQSFSSEFEIMRSDLCQLLHDTAAAEGAKYEYGKFVESFNERDGEVTVRYNDGSTGTYDLVCGADGLASRTRRMLFPGDDDGRSTLINLPERTAYFTMQQPIAEGERYIATAYMMPDRKFMMTRRHSPTTLQVYLMAETHIPAIKNMQRGDTASEKAAFIKTFRGAGWRTDEIAKVIEEQAEDWYCQYSGYAKIDTWSKGHIVLVGDAAHGVPADGMGTSAALIGAYILAGEIDRHCGKLAAETRDEVGDPLRDALVAYEQRYMPYIKSTHQEWHEGPGIFGKIPWNRLVIRLILALAWFASVIRLDLILARVFSSRGDVNGWVLPEYSIAVGH